MNSLYIFSKIAQSISQGSPSYLPQAKNFNANLPFTQQTNYKEPILQSDDLKKYINTALGATAIGITGYHLGYKPLREMFSGLQSKLKTYFKNNKALTSSILKKSPIIKSLLIGAPILGAISALGYFGYKGSKEG